MRETPYDAIFRKVGTEAGVDPALLKAVACAESDFQWMSYREEPGFWRRYLKDNPDWTGHPLYARPEVLAASWGLMQIMFTTACEAGFPRDGSPWELLQPETNIAIGARHLARLLARYNGKVPDAVSAYNGGIARWDAARNRYVNQGYVSRVMALLAEEKAVPTLL